MRSGMRLGGVVKAFSAVAAAVALMGLSAAGAAAQELADFDYVNLHFRGIGVEWGYLYPTRVEPTQSVAVRMDLGYLGPGVRVVPSVTYWSSRFKHAEVAKFENRVADLVVAQTGQPRPTVDLGDIDWSDVELALDAHVVWRVPFGILNYAGLGASAHVLNGKGAAIDGTFVEDLLDVVTAGFDVQAGSEYPVSDRLRFYGQARYEVLQHLRYFQLRFGAQVMIGKPAPGEERR